MNKKGAEMTVGTIVIIVLALIVLVVLVLGFTSGWGNLWERITAFFGGSNVDSVVQACQVACSTNAKSAFCDEKRPVKFSYQEKLVTIEITCDHLRKGEPTAAITNPKSMQGQTTIPPKTDLTCDIDCPA